MGDHGLRPKFLDLVENGWASEGNPGRTGIFIRRFVRKGRLNPGPVLELTDGKGLFWEISARSERLQIVGNLLTDRAALGVQEGDGDAAGVELQRPAGR